jgi:hypothetical protein
LNRFLRQAVQEGSSVEESRNQLLQLHKQIANKLNIQPQK